MDETVLVVEDDPTVRETASLLLERAGMRVTAVNDGRQAVELVAHERFDLVLLDLMLPSLDGFGVCRAIRRGSQIPIVMLTARTETIDVVTGLELGADDYVTKPFSGPELVARVRAALRRRTVDEDVPILKVADLEIDISAFRLKQSGRPVELTATEFRLLVELASHPGRVFSRAARVTASTPSDIAATGANSRVDGGCRRAPPPRREVRLSTGVCRDRMVTARRV